MRLFKTIPRYYVSFIKNQQSDLLLKDPLKDLKISVSEMQQRAQNKLIYRTQTGIVPQSIQDQWLKNSLSNGSKEIMLQEKQIDLPYNFEGIDQTPDEKSSFIVQSLFMQSKVRKDLLFEHLIKIYKGVLYSMAANDEEFLLEYTEKRFAQRLLKSLELVKSKGDTILAVENKTGDKGEPIPYACHSVQFAMIKGLSVDRSKNQSEDQYHIWRDIDEVGLVAYTPMNVTDPENFINQKLSENIYDPYKQAILRALVRVQSPLRLKVLKANGQEIFTDEDNYSFNHLVIFETQLELPPLNTGYQLLNQIQWLYHFKLNSWKLVEIDNWMEGNPLMINSKTREQFKEPIFEGTEFDSRCLIDLRSI